LGRRKRRGKRRKEGEEREKKGSGCPPVSGDMRLVIVIVGEQGHCLLLMALPLVHAFSV